jgi:protein gp37
MVADELGIEDIPTIESYFENEDDALEYAIHNQRNRRNLTPAEILKCVEVLYQRKQRGGNNNPYGRAGKPEESKVPNGIFDSGSEHQEMGENVRESNEISKNTEPDISKIITEAVTKDTSSDTAKEVARTLGMSRMQIARAAAINSEDTPQEIKDAVKSGKMSFEVAYQEARKAKKQTESIKKEATDTKSVFNESNDNIEWSIWTWNPVVGCRQGCQYCYAEGIANRFYPQKFEPTFYEERLPAPYNSKIPEKYKNHPGKTNVFVCSMADLFGDWVDEEWISKIMDVCRDTPMWNYLFLTKNPRRLLDYQFPENAWVGTTVDTNARLRTAIELMPQVDAQTRFISFEPLLEDMGEPNLSFIDWIIIGGQSGDTSRHIPEKQPEWTWVEKLLVSARKANAKVYFKPNLKSRPKEYPSI